MLSNWEINKSIEMSSISHEKILSNTTSQCDEKISAKIFDGNSVTILTTQVWVEYLGHFN